jgi:hypothetical protein
MANTSNVLCFSRARPARTQYPPPPAQIDPSAAPKDALVGRLFTSRAQAIAHLMFVARTAAGLAVELSKLDPGLAALLVETR